MSNINYFVFLHNTPICSILHSIHHTSHDPFSGSSYFWAPKRMNVAENDASSCCICVRFPLTSNLPVPLKLEFPSTWHASQDQASDPPHLPATQMDERKQQRCTTRPHLFVFATIPPPLKSPQRPPSSYVDFLHPFRCNRMTCRENDVGRCCICLRFPSTPTPFVPHFERDAHFEHPSYE